MLKPFEDETDGRLAWHSPRTQITATLVRYNAEIGYDTIACSVIEMGEADWLASGSETRHKSFDEARSACEKWALEELPKLLASKAI